MSPWRQRRERHRLDRGRAQPDARGDQGPLPCRKPLFERQRRGISAKPEFGEERARRQVVNPRLSSIATNDRRSSAAGPRSDGQQPGQRTARSNRLFAQKREGRLRVLEIGCQDPFLAAHDRGDGEPRRSARKSPL